MSNPIFDLIRAYRERTPEDAEKSLPEFVAERDPYVFAHHPPTPAFREHVWKIGSFYFCKGCVVTFAGVVFGVLLFLTTGWLRWLGDIQAGAVFLALLAPAVLAHALELPRWFRHVSRFLLGILMASAVFMLFVTDSWVVRVVIVVAYFGAKIPLERKRYRDNERLTRQEDTSFR